MTADREKIIDRIRKLRNLAEDKANLNEAEAAARMAGEMAERYRVEEAELTVLSMGKTEEEPVLEGVLDEGTNKSQWRVTLAMGLAKANNCSLYLHKGSDFRGKRTTQVKIVGNKSNIEVVSYLFAMFCRQVELMANIQGRGLGVGWISGFKMGAASTLYHRFQEGKTKGQEGASSTALVLLSHETEAVEEYLRTTIGKMKKDGYKKKVGYDSRGVNAGREAANRMDITPGRGSLDNSNRRSFPSR